MLSKIKLNQVLNQMEIMFPNASCELNYSNALQLLIAVVLSAQCTDALVNKVTPALFSKYPNLEDFIEAPLEDIEEAIRRIGLFRNKAKFIKQLTLIIMEDFGGEIPSKMEDLMKLPGVGRKTANVVLSVWFGVPAIAVDTHVERVSKRLELCPKKASVLEVEQTLMRKVPKNIWSKTHHLFIFFGRYHCKAQNPKCAECPFSDFCKEGKKRLKVVKPV
ncbi:MAG: nth [Bacillales bacterium]|jgi:endonuclease-3|nr:nth [Bacillales bacterium]